MSSDNNLGDPLEFLRRMWGNMGFGLPGMVTPTLDVDELDRRITDLRAVEGWLKMNLSMLQMTVQGLEVQRATLAAVRAMSQPAQSEAGETPVNPFANPALWAWPFAGMTPPADAADDGPDAPPPEDEAPPAKPRRGSRKA
ncbi:MAG: hypothetical protein REI94_18910 [Moraxellaceae bacterium]|nr:hypothetical protein [Moraxellaceae bacterium]